MKHYIYKITSPNGCIYIGQTINLKNRISEYRRLKCKCQPKIYKSLIEYGFDSHTFEIIIEADISLDIANRLEYYFIELYNTFNTSHGLNSMHGGKNGIHSDDTKLKMSKYAVRSVEHRNAISEANRNRVIKDSTRLKQSIAKKGGKLSDEHKLKIAANKSRAKVVLDLSNGVYYLSAFEASEFNNINYQTLRSRLNGGKVNKTNFVYA